MAITVRHKPLIINVFGIQAETLDGWSIKFKDQVTGLPIDISGIDFYYTVKKSWRKTDPGEAVINKAPADAVKTASVDATIDTLSFPLTPADTDIPYGKYVHAIKMVDGSEERTYMEGTFELEERRVDTV